MEPAAALHTRKHALERRIGLVIHLAVYVAVNTGLILFNLLLAPERTWFYWPLFGWGIGLLCHSLAVFLSEPVAEWKQSMVEHELNGQK